MGIDRRLETKKPGKPGFFFVCLNLSGGQRLLLSIASAYPVGANIRNYVTSTTITDPVNHGDDWPEFSATSLTRYQTLAPSGADP